jgi:hypothetical protein
VHINALDAYEDSPLWQEYVDKDIIAKGKSGTPLKGIVWSGLQSYPLSYAREWETWKEARRPVLTHAPAPYIKSSMCQAAD